MVRLNAVLDSLKAIRQDTAQAVDDFSAHDLNYKPCDGVMTFGELARHILEAGHVLTGALLDEVDSFATPQFRELFSKYAAELPKTDGPGALARELRAEMETRLAQLAAKPSSFWEGEITRRDGLGATRLEMLQFVKEHELTHRQQLFMYLRLNGLVPPTTRRRMAQAKA